MDIRRLDRASLGRLRGKGGYVLNVHTKGTVVHRLSCPLVTQMNLEKKGGVHYATTLEDASRWMRGKGMEGRHCSLCLSRLASGPRPEKLVDHFRRP